jgi:membrane protease YdiL (CAAX protease family)
VRRHSWIIAAITVAILIVVSYIHAIIYHIPQYRWLHRQRPFYIAESFDKIGGVVICMLAIWLMRRIGLRGIGRELGLSAPPLPAIAFALIASLPMLIGFAITRSLPPHIQILPLLFTTVFSPIVEEIEFRGFGVRHLQRATGWPFWVAVWPSAVLFGAVHVEQGQSSQEMAALFFLIGAGGVMFAWMVHRWQNLWVAIALHIFMNSWWDLFSVSRSAIGGWFPFVLQNLTMLSAILITLYWTRSKRTATTSA